MLGDTTMTNTQHTTAQITAEENVHVRVHTLDRLRDYWPGWDANPTWVKRLLAGRTPATEEHEHSNTTTIGLHEYLVDNLHTGTEANETASHLAVGSGNADPSSGNNELNDEVARTEVTDSSNNGTSLFTSTFFDTSEANGNDLVEVGLVTSDTGGSDILLNHSLISEISKTDETTATIDVTLTFEGA